jgi:hypothetical protein
MDITRSKAGKPIYSGKMRPTQKKLSIEIKEERSAGADERRSLTCVEISNLEFLELTKVYLHGRTYQWLIDAVVWFFKRVENRKGKHKVMPANARFSRKALKAYRSWVNSKVMVK